MLTFTHTIESSGGYSVALEFNSENGGYVQYGGSFEGQLMVYAGSYALNYEREWSQEDDQTTNTEFNNEYSSEVTWSVGDPEAGDKFVVQVQSTHTPDAPHAAPHHTHTLAAMSSYPRPRRSSTTPSSAHPYSAPSVVPPAAQPSPARSRAKPVSHSRSNRGAREQRRTSEIARCLGNRRQQFSP
jgi:hypothetical protein